MATQRYISTSFWNDRWIRSLDPSERYLYLYLMTNPQTNIAGVYKITLDRIAFDTGHDERTLQPMLQRFAEAGKAFFYEEEWMILPAWPKHQQWHKHTKIRTGIISILQDCPKDVINVAAEIGYQFDLSQVDSTIVSTKQRVGISGRTKRMLINASHGHCASCGIKSDEVEIHHIIPVKDGGTNAYDNLEVLCKDCHKNKHSPDTLSQLSQGPDTLSGLNYQSTYPSNYSDSDSDSDSDRDRDSSNTTEPEKPGSVSGAESYITTAIPESANKPEKTYEAAQLQKNPGRLKDDLAAMYEEAFTQEVPLEAWKSIPQERKHLIEIAKRTRRSLAVTPYDTSEKLAGAIMAEFAEQRRTGKGDYWRKAPYTPSSLTARWDQVIEGLRQRFESAPVEDEFYEQYGF